MKDSAMGRRIARNTARLSIGEAAALASGIVWTALVARYVGPATYGVYAGIHATLATLVILVNLGLDRLVTRDVAQQPAEGWSYFVTASVIKVLLSVIVLGGYLLSVVLSDASEGELSIALILTGMWCVANFFNLATAFLWGYEAMHYAVVGRVLNAVVTVTTGAIAIWFQQPFTVVLLLSLFASMLQLLVSYRFAMTFRPEGTTGFRNFVMPIPRIRQLLVSSAPFAVMVMFAGLNANLMILLVHHITQDETSVGYLSAAMRIYSVVIILLSVLDRSIVPALSSHFSRSPNDFAGTADTTYRYITFLTMPMGVGLWAVGPGVSQLIFGDAYSVAGSLLSVLGLVLITGFGYTVSASLEAMRRQFLNAVIFGGIVVANAVLGYWMIARIGVEGAVWTPVITAGAGFFVYAIVLYRLLKRAYPVMWVLKSLVASVGMGIVARMASERISVLVVTFLIAPAIYIGIHLVLKTLSPSDWVAGWRLLPDRVKYTGLARQLKGRIEPLRNE